MSISVRDGEILSRTSPVYHIGTNFTIAGSDSGNNERGRIDSFGCKTIKTDATPWGYSTKSEINRKWPFRY